MPRFHDWARKKNTHVDGRAIVALLLGGLILAQFVAYKNLRQADWRRIADLSTENRKLGEEASGLRALILEKDKRIDDLRDKQIEGFGRLTGGGPQEAPSWIADVRFTQENQKHEYGYGTWLATFPLKILKGIF